MTELSHSEQICKYTHMCHCRSQYQRHNAAEDVDRPHVPVNRNITILRYSNPKVHLWSQHNNKHFLFVFKTLKSSEDPLFLYSPFIVVWSLHRYCTKTTPSRLSHTWAPIQLKGSIQSLDNRYFITVANNSQTQAIYYAYTLHLNVTIPCPAGSVHWKHSQTSIKLVRKQVFKRFSFWKFTQYCGRLSALFIWHLT